jgi:hypothetical protein
MTFPTKEEVLMEKGQQVLAKFENKYGFEVTEHAEVVMAHDGPLPTVTVTYMADDGDESVTIPQAQATVVVARVTYGFSCYDDFETMEEALQRAAELAREPMRDPLGRNVRILDLTRKVGEGAASYFPTLLAVKRPARTEVTA